MRKPWVSITPERAKQIADEAEAVRKSVLARCAEMSAAEVAVREAKPPVIRAQDGEWRSNDASGWMRYFCQTPQGLTLYAETVPRGDKIDAFDRTHDMLLIGTFEGPTRLEDAVLFVTEYFSWVG